MGYIGIALTSAAMPSANTYSAVTNDWYNANFSNVYERAQQRLSANTNDVVAAYLMLEWNVAFGTRAAVSNAVTHAIEVSDLVTNLPFKTAYLGLRDDYIDYRDNVLPTFTDAEIEKERYKSYLPHKSMVEDFLLNQLWVSGLWQ